MEMIESQPRLDPFQADALQRGPTEDAGQGRRVVEGAAKSSCSFEDRRPLCWVEVKPPRFPGCQITPAFHHLIIHLVSYEPPHVSLDSSAAQHKITSFLGFRLIAFSVFQALLSAHFVGDLLTITLRRK